MDAVAFERVYEAFQDFHAQFAPLFGRREARDLSRHYPQALLVQSGERAQRRESLRGGSGLGPGDAAVSHRIPLGRRRGGRTSPRSTWHRGWNIRRRCGCWTAATFPSRAGSRREWPGSIAGGWVRWPTARQVCSWPTSARWGVRWWTNGFTCRRVGPRTKSGARRQECL